MGLPPYSIGTQGVYSHISGKILHLLDSADILKPEVFQTCREIGNIIAFIRDLSDVLDLNDQFRFMNLAPFLSLCPDASIESLQGLQGKDKQDEAVAATPIGSVFNNLASFASTSTHSSEILGSKDSFTRLPMVAKELAASMSTVVGSRSLFQRLLINIKERMSDRNSHNGRSFFEEWGLSSFRAEGSTSASPYQGLELIHTKAFFRFWAAMSFLFNHQEDAVKDKDKEKKVKDTAKDGADGDDDADTPPEEESAIEVVIQDEEEFGHGFCIAGTLFLHMLGQRDVYESTDFSYYVLKVHAQESRNQKISSTSSSSTTDPSSVSASGSATAADEEVNRFVESTNAYKHLQDELFSLFDTMFPSSVGDKESQSKRFHPPPAM